MKSVIRIGLFSVFLFVPLVTFAQWAPGTAAYDTYLWGQNQNVSSFLTFSGTYGSGGGAGSGIWYVARLVLNIIDGILVPLLFAISFIVFLYGVAKSYIFSKGSDKAVGEGHQIILWGLIGFAVMISVWGLVNIAVQTLGLSGSRPLIPPISPYVGPMIR